MQTALSTSRSERYLSLSSRTWLGFVFGGQALFATYLLLFYGGAAVMGQIERWGEATSKGYISGDGMGNVVFGCHVLVAAIITIGGPMQLLPWVRRHYPRLHRINGRLYIACAFLMSIGGLYLTWIRGTVGGLLDHVFVTCNAIIIMTCAIFTIRRAMARKLEAHAKWALRLFLAMSGVYFFRLGLMFWIFINQGPAGFDPETFTGPALTVLGFIVYVTPIFILELYFRIREGGTDLMRYTMSSGLVLLTLATIIGIALAAAGMWYPMI